MSETKIYIMDVINHINDFATQYHNEYCQQEKLKQQCDEVIHKNVILQEKVTMLEISLIESREANILLRQRVEQIRTEMEP